ncbi:hypothetical protein DN824_21615 [Stutzerimonas nosocomialis]|uniref:hypothetical protein n=1 Tax=Stutzerimonas nosocomialis TaxID=1056496 RepID=UPI001108AE15|nr:hypothetical protein [Stutzerimonas nosocomialis]TLX53815.1 hypothetical protein DN824_21615 [Stutzerimonas nosocomialis]
MANIDSISGALTRLGVAVSTALSLVVGAEAAYVSSPTQKPGQASVRSTQQFVSVLDEIRSSAADVGELLDEVLRKMITDHATVRQLNVQTFIALGDTLRSLENHTRQSNDFVGEPAQRREYLRALASIRSRVSQIVSVARQCQPPANPVDSPINRSGLSAIADHSSRHIWQMVG